MPFGPNRSSCHKPQHQAFKSIGILGGIEAVVSLTCASTASGLNATRYGSAPAADSPGSVRLATCILPSNTSLAMSYDAFRLNSHLHDVFQHCLQSIHPGLASLHFLDERDCPPVYERLFHFLLALQEPCIFCLRLQFFRNTFVGPVGRDYAIPCPLKTKDCLHGIH